ncbi:hypothetical protein AB6Q85_003313, partial [Vibrio cholerae]
MNKPSIGRYWDIADIDLEQYNYRSRQPNLTDTHGFSIHSDYYQGVEAAYQYTYDVLTGIRKAGQAEIAACERFIF